MSKKNKRVKYRDALAKGNVKVGRFLTVVENGVGYPGEVVALYYGGEVIAVRDAELSWYGEFTEGTKFTITPNPTGAVVLFDTEGFVVGEGEHALDLAYRLHLLPDIEACTPDEQNQPGMNFVTRSADSTY